MKTLFRYHTVNSRIAYQIEIEPKAKESFCRTNFEFLIFFLIFFQIFMIRFGRTELELRASFALNLLNLMLYYSETLKLFSLTEKNRIESNQTELNMGSRNPNFFNILMFFRVRFDRTEL